MSVGVSSIRTCKSGFVLVIGMDRNLVIARITVQEAKEGMLRQTLQHFIDERTGKVVSLGGLVKLAIVYAHTPPCDGALRDELIGIIVHYRHASLLKDRYGEPERGGE
jgi:hypothetical protein